MNAVTKIFDRALVRRRRDRAVPHWHSYDFLHRTIVDELTQRLDMVTGSFATGLDFGCRGGELSAQILQRTDIEWMVMSDLSPCFARRGCGVLDHACVHAVSADEEALPFAEGIFDLAAGCLSLHTVNDLPGALLQLRRTLRPNGLFLAALFGGGTLGALRTALVSAESEIYQGCSPRVAPFTDIRDAGTLLQRAGFTQPVVDDVPIAVTYKDLFSLMRDLRGMGESNPLVGRRDRFDRRCLFERAQSLYPDKADDGELVATFHVLVLTAWGA